MDPTDTQRLSALQDQVAHQSQILVKLEEAVTALVQENIRRESHNNRLEKAEAVIDTLKADKQRIIGGIGVITILFGIFGGFAGSQLTNAVKEIEALKGDVVRLKAKMRMEVSKTALQISAAEQDRPPELKKKCVPSKGRDCEPEPKPDPEMPRTWTANA